MPLYVIDALNTKLSANDTEDSKTLNAVSQTSLSTYLSSQGIKEYVSPGGYMIVDFVPLKAVHSNIRYMTGPEEYTSIFSDIRKENGKCRGLLLFGTVYQIRRPPFQCVLDIFGSDNQR